MPITYVTTVRAKNQAGRYEVIDHFECDSGKKSLELAFKHLQGNPECTVSIMTKQR